MYPLLEPPSFDTPACAPTVVIIKLIYQQPHVFLQRLDYTLSP